MKRITSLILVLAFSGCPRVLPAQQFDRTYAPSSETVDYNQLPLQCPGGVCPAPILRPPASRPPANIGTANVPAEIVAASVRVSFDEGKVDPRTRERVMWGGSGTVFYVAPPGTVAAEAYCFVLTNNHVAPHRNAKIGIHFPNGVNVAAGWVATSDNADLTILCAIVDPSTPYVPLAETSANRGEAVWQVGYPLGRGPVPRQGQARGPEGSAGKSPRVFSNYGFTVETDQGDSGSGFFRQSDGRLCGVLWGGAPGRGSAAVGVEDVHRLIAQHCNWLVGGKPAQRPPVNPVSPGGPPVPTGPLTPVQPVEPAWKKPLAEVLGEIGKIKSDLAGIKPTPGPQGPPGPKGDPGPAVAGPPGQPGRDGQHAPTERIERIESAVRDYAWVAPALITTLATGGTGGLVLIGLKLAGTFAGRRVAARKKKATGGPTPPDAQAPAPGEPHPAITGGFQRLERILSGFGDLLSRLQPAVATPTPQPVEVRQSTGPAQVPIILHAPSAPQVVRTETNFVPYEAPSVELAALKQALEEVIKRNPGAIDLVETVKGYAAQIESGMAKPK